MLQYIQYYTHVCRTMPRLPVVIIIIIYDNDDDDLTYSDAADRGKIVRPVLVVVRKNNNGIL